MSTQVVHLNSKSAHLPHSLKPFSLKLVTLSLVGMVKNGELHSKQEMVTLTLLGLFQLHALKLNA